MDLIWQERNRKVRQQQTVKTPHGYIVHQTESALLSAVRFNYVSTSLRSQYIRIKSYLRRLERVFIAILFVKRRKITKKDV